MEHNPPYICISDTGRFRFVNAAINSKSIEAVECARNLGIEIRSTDLVLEAMSPIGTTQFTEEFDGAPIITLVEYLLENGVTFYPDPITVFLLPWTRLSKLVITQRLCSSWSTSIDSTD